MHVLLNVADNERCLCFFNQLFLVSNQTFYIRWKSMNEQSIVEQEREEDASTFVCFISYHHREALESCK